MYHLSSVTCHLTTNPCSFSCYKSPVRFGAAAERDLVIYKVLKKLWETKEEEKDQFLSKPLKQHWCPRGSFAIWGIGGDCKTWILRDLGTRWVRQWWLGGLWDCWTFEGLRENKWLVQPKYLIHFSNSNYCPFYPSPFYAFCDLFNYSSFLVL